MAALKKLLLLIAVVLIATGWTDLDWMLTCNHYQFGQCPSETWTFCPFFSCNWWLAFQFTLARILVGSVILGWILEKL